MDVAAVTYSVFPAIFNGWALFAIFFPTVFAHAFLIENPFIIVFRACESKGGVPERAVKMCSILVGPFEGIVLQFVLKFPFFSRLLKKASTALITQIRKNDYTDISMGFNL